MLAKELADELRLIAFCDKAKPVNRVSALASLARNGLEPVRVRDTLYSLAIDKTTPDSVKVRAIDLLDKLDLTSAPKELSADEAAAQAKALMEKYVG